MHIFSLKERKKEATTTNIECIFEIMVIQPKLSNEKQIYFRCFQSDESNSTPTELPTLPSLPTAASLDYETPLPTPTPATAAAAAAPNQRLRYDRQELLRIRDSSSSFPVPELPNLDIVVSNTGNRRAQPYGGTNSSQGGGRGFNRQSSMSNHPSLNRYPTNSITDSKQRNKPAIYLSNEPDFGNRVENPYKPIDQSKVDANHKVLRDCKAILNKVTPQTYEKLLKQLEALEIDRYERLEGMINIFFSKVTSLFASSLISFISLFFFLRLLMSPDLVFSMLKYVNNFKRNKSQFRVKMAKQ